jgi:hypothetical protein
MEHADTILSVPNRYGAAAFMVQLNLDVDDPDMSGIDGLLEQDALAAMEEALAIADAAAPAGDHVAHALAHLAADELRNAWPPLVIGVEGLFWAEAEEHGFLDDDGRFSAKAARSGPPSNAIDIILALPINPRVQRFLRRFAFGGPANAFRHGRLHGIGERQQCLMWLLALVVWFDGEGWRRFAPSDNPSGGR